MMLDFINNNGILFSGICTIITAFITGIGSLIAGNKSAKQDTVRSLKQDLADTKKELDECKAAIAAYQSIENAEKVIDKSNGSIYREKLSNGQTRDICGFCWENNHKKIPLIVSQRYDEYERRNYYYGQCQACKSDCIENISPEPPVEYVGGTTNAYTAFINA